jgi:hypothetical protein
LSKSWAELPQDPVERSHFYSRRLSFGLCYQGKWRKLHFVRTAWRLIQCVSVGETCVSIWIFLGIVNFTLTPGDLWEAVGWQWHF